MARKKRTGGRRKQGVVSWLTSVIAILLALGPALLRLWWAINGRPFGDTLNDLNKLYNPMAGDRNMLMQGYGSLVGGLAFKIVTAELSKRAKVKSVIPALHA